MRICVITILVLTLSISTSSAASQESTQQDLRPAGTGEETYVLQRGDILEIKVFNIAELDTTVTIRPDGKISVLLLDDIEAAGRTTTQLDELLTARYAPFYLDPRVTINVKGFANYKIYVGGEVVQPGLFPLVGDLTAVRALIQAGGPKITAKTSHVILLRESNGVPVAMVLNLKDVIDRGKPDVRLSPFDVLYVPKSAIAKVNTFVDQYIKQMLPLSLTAGFSYLLNYPFPGP
jgi:protein involved in polysaccharide export with SLBB domain